VACLGVTMTETELEQLRAEVQALRDRVTWLEAALGLLIAKFDRDAEQRRDPRLPPTNLWGLAGLGKELTREMRDESSTPG
jgi:hypothetical protein